tara:strand:+ start:8131 stop:8334 length:204 start_codon:yes stop_codon:yes gene_type:complete
MFKTFKQDKKVKTFKKNDPKSIKRGTSNLEGVYQKGDDFLTKLKKKKKKKPPKQSQIFGSTPNKNGK